MNNSDSNGEKPTSVVKRSFPFFLRVFSWRNLKVILFVGACLVTLGALFHLEENWRGKRALAQYMQEVQARGDWYGRDKLIPPPVPDAQNFAMTPALFGLFDRAPGTSQLRDTNAYAKAGANFLPSVSTVFWSEGKETDYERYLEDMRKRAREAGRSVDFDAAASDRQIGAKEVLRLLKEQDPLLTEIQTASQRPGSRFNIDYLQENKAAILLPHLAIIKMYSGAFATRSSAELVCNQIDDAAEDVMTSFRIADSVKNEPILISYLVRLRCVALNLQPVWEGLGRHQWSEPQLKQMQATLQNYNLMKDAVFALHAERDFFGTSIFELLKAKPAEAVGAIQESGISEGPVWFRVVIPQGWIDFEEVNYLKLFTGCILPTMDAQTRRINVAEANANQARLDAEFNGLAHMVFQHKILSRLLLPALTKVERSAGRAQTCVDLASVACALERYRLALGHYPEKLAEVVPGYIDKIPNDVFTGEPLKYRCTQDGRFVLYSVGWNAKDDGGKPERFFDNNFPTKNPEADWVWYYPEQNGK